MTWSGLDRRRLPCVPQYPVERMRSGRAPKASERGYEPLDGLDRNRADLDFLGRMRWDELLCIDAIREGVGVCQHTATSQHVWYEIVSKQRQRCEIIEATEAAITKGPVKISRSDLCAFVEGNVQLTIWGDIPVERHPCERTHESLRGSVRIVDDGFETIAILRRKPDAEISPSARIERHQFRNLGVTQILSEQLRHRLRRGRSKRLTGPAPVRLEAFSAGGRERGCGCGG